MMENSELPPSSKNIDHLKIRFNLNKNQLSCFISERPSIYCTPRKCQQTVQTPKPLIQLLSQESFNGQGSYNTFDFGQKHPLVVGDEVLIDQVTAQQAISQENVEDEETYEIVSQCLKVLNDEEKQSDSMSTSSFRSDITQKSTGQFSNQSKYFKNKFKAEDYQFMIYPHLTKTDGRTTLMLRNIPNKYTQDMILQEICAAGLNGKYDFFYLPIDYKNQCNVGYAFINMVNVQYVPKIYEMFHNKKWARFNSEKICQVCYARLQGTPQLLNHFRYSNAMSKDQKLRPLIYLNLNNNGQEEKKFGREIQLTSIRV